MAIMHICTCLWVSGKEHEHGLGQQCLVHESKGRMCCGCAGGTDKMRFTVALATVLLALLAGQAFAEEELRDITFDGRKMSMRRSWNPQGHDCRLIKVSSLQRIAGLNLTCVFP